ncbi:MAG: hypothetical protein ACXAEF_05565 [Candidatus Thorarchaeota archaeon]|jgi:hypothetical protein
MKRNIICLLTILLLIPTPTSALVYDSVSYTSSDVQVDVVIEAGTQWSSPFTENVNVTIGVVPMFTGITETNITSVTLVLYRVEVDASGYFLIAAEEETGTPLVEGGAYANYSNEFSLTGNAGGLQCYFSLLVRGTFGNATSLQSYQALSQEDLVGPFAITTGIGSPVAWVGLIVIGVSSLVFIAGVYGVKRSRTRRRRKSLMDD